MFDLPLHPVLVHFPIVFGVILPVAGFLFWWGIKNYPLPQKVWVLVVALTFAYSISAWVAVEVGENDKEKVEKIVAEKVIENHEETAEMIPWMAGALLLVSVAGLALKNSHSARLAFCILSLLAVIPLAHAGHSGGQLVYQYGAANAHLPAKYRKAVQTAGFNWENQVPESRRQPKEDD